MQSPDEIFDVVDENDVVVGQATRRSVHEKGLLHRAAHILVFNSSGHLFLQKRSATKDNFPGTWDSSAAGHLDSGETYAQCACRELQEELGITPCPSLALLFKLQASEQTGYEFSEVYRCQYDGPIHLDPLEIETGEWFPEEVIEGWIRRSPESFAGCFVEIWKRYRENQNGD